MIKDICEILISISYILLNNECTLEELQAFKLGTIKAKFFLMKMY